MDALCERREGAREEEEEADFNSQFPMPTHHRVVRGRSRARAENEARAVELTLELGRAGLASEVW